jgi:phosphohistidine phosphatase
MTGSVQLYLVRHAIAEPRGDAWPDDTQRPLSDEGRVKMTKQVKGLNALEVRVDEILTSPLVRTRQTADILAHGLSGRPKVVELPVLAPGHRPKELFAALEDFAKRSSLAIVGHEPGMGELLAALIGARTPIPFKKGGVALVEVGMLPPAAGSAALIWSLTPRVLRKVAG